MFRQLSVKVVSKNILLVLTGMVLAALLMSSSLFTSPTASAKTMATSSTLEQNSPDGQNWITCVPVAVANFDNRVHVRCAAPVGNIHFFAAPTSNYAYAARVLSTLSAAQVAGRTLDILYDPDDISGESFGCGALDCRRIIAVGFGQ